MSSTDVDAAEGTVATPPTSGSVVDDALEQGEHAVVQLSSPPGSSVPTAALSPAASPLSPTNPPGDWPSGSMGSGDSQANAVDVGSVGAEYQQETAGAEAAAVASAAATVEAAGPPLGRAISPPRLFVRAGSRSMDRRQTFTSVFLNSMQHGASPTSGTEYALDAGIGGQGCVP